MLASRHSGTSEPGAADVRQRRRRRRALDAVVLVAIVALGAAGAFAAGIVVMPSASRGLLAAGGTPAVSAADGQTTSASTSDPGSSAQPGPSGQPAPGASDAAQQATASGPAPWLAWRPRGQGQLKHLRLPAPWTGGTKTDISATIYLPPGYATSSRSYPVIYEEPFSWGLWSNRIGMKSLLDAEITSGAFPASIVVFVQTVHGPYHDTECVNSLDGRQLLETFFASTLVHAIDTRFRTIPTAAARSTLGFSQGGYCAAMLTLRHPDVFATALAISGYYQAGILSSQTPSAWLPFGGNAAFENAYSPLQIVGQLTPAQRASVQLVLEADPSQLFYGPQYAAMLAAAQAAGVSAIPVTEPLPHSWPLVKLSLPAMLRALAAHEVALHVFG